MDPQAEIHPAEDLSQRKPPSDRAGFLYRLGIYSIGIAIGFMILGMFRAKSAVEARRRAAEQAAFEAQFSEPPVLAEPSKATPGPGTTPAPNLVSPR